MFKNVLKLDIVQVYIQDVLTFNFTDISLWFSGLPHINRGP